MQIAIDEARALLEGAMRAVGHSARDAAIIADHLMDCELRGVQFGGLPRALSIIERIEGRPDRRKPIAVTRETPVSAFSRAAIRSATWSAIARPRWRSSARKKSGIGIVGANNTWFTGMFSYYMEMATREDMVAMAIGNASPRVAPDGSTEGRFGTNPIAFGFPTYGDPVIWDIGTSAVMAGEVALALRMGTLLPEGRAFDRERQSDARSGRSRQGRLCGVGRTQGLGPCYCVQMLGMMCNTLPFPPLLAGCGFIMMAMSPGHVHVGRGLQEERLGVRRRGSQRKAARCRQPGAHAVRPFCGNTARQPRARYNRGRAACL